MLQKNAYEPKDARIVSYYEDEDDDDLADLDPSRPNASRKKKTTGTQALAEFLSTTSPEEFQRNQKGNAPFSTTAPVEPSSTNFFKLRKSKRSLAQRHHTTDLVSDLGISSTSTLVTTNPSSASVISMASTQTASTAHKKNYIEIVPKATSPPTQQQTSSSPMLPQMGQHKKRESSLYSDSLRYSASIKSQLSGGGATAGRKVGRSLTRQDTTTTLRSMASGHTINSLYQKQPSGENAAKESMDDQQKRNLTQAFLSGISKMELVEAGLVQRLERCKLAGYEKPSDMMANLLVNEHVRALDVSFQQQANGGGTINNNNNNNRISIKVRHAQVQTMPLKDEELENQLMSQPITVSGESPNDKACPVTITKTQPTSTTPTTMEQLERQLAEEREHRQRLQVSLENTRDHFEVLSGLAYKKLREIWEEKLRWENTCMQLNDQLILIQQQQQEHPGHYQPSYDEMEESGSVLDKENQLTLSVVS